MLKSDHLRSVEGKWIHAGTEYINVDTMTSNIPKNSSFTCISDFSSGKRHAVRTTHAQMELDTAKHLSILPA